MDRNRKIYRFLLSFVLAPICLFAQPEKGEAGQSAPLRVLYVTGGGWHDYEGQTPIVKAIIKDALGEVDITVSVVGGFGRQNPDFNFHPAFKEEDWAEGFDLVVYNKCNSPGFSDDEWVERIVTPHREGLPAVLIHGTLHNFWPDEERTGLWNQFCGITSRNHEPRAPVTTTVEMPDHPIMAGLPEQWSHEPGELYRAHGMQEGVKSLATGISGEGEEHTTVWAHQFGQGRVFGTTIGHATEIFEGEEFQRLLKQGIQWAVGRL